MEMIANLHAQMVTLPILPRRYALNVSRLANSVPVLINVQLVLMAYS